MAVALKIPAVGESVSEVTISQWLKSDGDYVEMDEVVAELESEKATVELIAPEAGALKISVSEGSDVAVGSVVGEIDTSAKAPEGASPMEKSAEPKLTSAEPAKNTPKAETKPSTQNEKPIPSPSAAKLMRENNITSNQVKGSGKEGRITKGDVLNALEYVKQPGSRDSDRQKMSNLRKAVSRRLVSAKNETAMLTTFNEANMKPIMDLRSAYKEKFKEVHGVGLGFMSFFTRACVLALQKYPAVNAYIDGEEIVYNNFVDISIAVSGPKGLMVPVIRNAESMSMAEIEAEVMRLAIRARDGKLGIDEMTGGTFTISNGGVFGSMMSTPIINPPQSAILGMHNILERPVVEKGEIVARPMMYLALSYDHRIIDGRESVGFLVTVKNYLENPMSLINGSDPTNQLLGF
ncbi:MAG: 2-oxoglutarate dehydrogenase complex dihydrolipoyllysine-residue succinyltransferase [Flavobacteriales bacterium]|nr:2-oxoglutarate dehydrogenase complex dihydrolipoyllysine-residue succinyltransferase [Bacteroidota bacterium]MCB9240790.1 2-oxoglutarate dehydrogenase complex dihydrolipoyllysine-residue succinyltransferase [Flavobacteriales bacterium]